MATTDHFDIKHDKQAKKFYVELNGDEGKLDYKKLSEDTLEYYSTFVPEKHRHQGIAGKITEEALEYAQENDYKVKPSCPFVDSYIRRHESDFSDVRI